MNPIRRGGRYWPSPLPMAVLVGREREGRTLCVLTEPVTVFSTRFRLAVPIPAGYLTDWASVPSLAQVRIQPFGRHAWAALVHDWLYSVGEPQLRWLADDLFREKLEEADVPFVRRAVMHRSVRLFGTAGYARAEANWETSFAQPTTGDLSPPPFTRSAAFNGAEHGPRPWMPALMP